MIAVRNTATGQPTFRILVGSWGLLTQRMAFDIPTAGGATTVSEALEIVAEVNRELKAKYGVEIAVSAHLWRELQMNPKVNGLGDTAEFNKPGAISLEEWSDGIRAGEFAPIGRIIPPGFGLPWSDDGAFTNFDQKARIVAHDALIHCMRLSNHVKGRGLGLGEVIVWDGPDGIRWNRLPNGDDPVLSYDSVPDLPEWKSLIYGVGNAIREARTCLGLIDERVLIEGKPGGDPCYIGVMTDPCLAITAINQINEIAGIKIAEWQGEFCHERGAGIKFSSAMRQVINGGVFNGRIHLNAGPLARSNFSNLLRRGTPLSRFQQYVDLDLLPGHGVEEWLQDQRKSLEIGARWSKKTGKPFEVEFDARFSRYANMAEMLMFSAEFTIRELLKYGAIALPMPKAR